QRRQRQHHRQRDRRHPLRLQLQRPPSPHIGAGQPADRGHLHLQRLGPTHRQGHGGSTERYAYDQANHLIGEYGNATHRDYIWVDDLPVAVIDNTINVSVTTSTDNYIIADSLNSPRRVMNAAGTTIWSWPVLG